MSDLPEFALSIMQPWSGLIVHGLKDIENRSWPTRFRGPVLIHAGLKLDKDAMEDIDDGLHPVLGGPLSGHHGLLYPRGGIVGVAEIVDCVASSPSPWFVGEYGFVIRNAKPLPFMPCKGALSFFRPDFSPPAAASPSPAPAPAPSPQSDLFATPKLEG